MEQTEKVGEELYTWLESIQLTNVRLAKLIGVSRASVQGWLTGAVQPNLATALQLEALSRGAVPLECWLTAEQRARLDRCEKPDALAA